MDRPHSVETLLLLAWIEEDLQETARIMATMSPTEMTQLEGQLIDLAYKMHQSRLHQKLES